ncbi:phosphoethanolamine transferase [Campylobacter sp. 19-13652]|uniref:phosphoethanolamine transferase n=1 Tax=Campylobacter sp. 19-13652 TaxID=2840180 RepID=UPI001C758E60|nr:phosphoethanolamine--lipid A transferase [Campylobacter sp. 19-13652]BCX79974.1 lipid A/FlgG phosphoethanolamine transferase EptC [Campylobacter sp. 19-13652]
MKPISSMKFNLIFALYLTVLNYKFFEFCLQNLPDDSTSWIMFATLPVVMVALLMLVFSLIFVPFTTKPLAILLLSISAPVAYFMNTYGIVIGNEIIISTLKTDVKEAGALINFRLIGSLFLLWIAPAILIIKCKISYGNLFGALIKRIGTIAATAGFITLCFAMLSKAYIPFFRNNHEAKMYIIPTYATYSAYKVYHKLTAKPVPLAKIGEDAALNDDKKRLFILIIGETARAANSSLNGYTTNDTNAYTKGISGLVSFSDFYSCGTYTARSVPCLLSPFTRDEFTDFKGANTENLTDILARVNVPTFWYDNNSGGCIGGCTRLPEQNVQEFKDKNKEGDAKIFKLAGSKIDELTDSALIVLHLQGSHGPAYYERYPKEFDRFKPTCDTNELSSCTTQEIVNTYDNTLLYTDYLIANLIKNLQKNEVKFDEIGLLYASDHGESLGENGIYLHGMPYSIAPDFQKHIPAIVYTNNQNTNKRLKLRKDDTLSHDNIFSTVLGFFGVKSDIVDDKLNIFSYNQGKN